MRSNTNRAHARTTTSVRNSEGLVQVQVTNICANVTRIGKSNLSVHVRTVHVYLSAVGVNDICNFIDGFLEYTVCRRISNHQCSKVVFV